MKKLFLIVVSAFLLTSCEYHLEKQHVRKVRKTNVVYFDNLSLYEEKLFGVWGCTDLWFGREQVKTVSIGEYGIANVQLQSSMYSDRYNRTYNYVYSGRYITFINYRDNSERFQFKIVDYKPGSLWLQDCMGKHEVRIYGY